MVLLAVASFASKGNEAVKPTKANNNHMGNLLLTIKPRADKVKKQGHLCKTFVHHPNLAWSAPIQSGA